MGKNKKNCRKKLTFGFFINRLYKILLAIKFHILIKPFLKNCGKNSIILNPIFISFENTIIGNNVYIGCHARIESVEDWNGEAYEPEILIGNDVSIEQNLHLICAGVLSIGAGTTISSNVFISDVNHDFKSDKSRKITLNNLIYKRTRIGKNCFIGTGAVILPGSILGDGVIVGANAVLGGVFADNSVVVGAPGRIIKFNE